MNQINPDSEARRESARQADGKFGPQEHAEAVGGTDALRSYTCDCGESFTSWDDLNEHQWSQRHGEHANDDDEYVERDDSCSYCGRTHSDLSACYVSGEPERGTEAHSEWARLQAEIADEGDDEYVERDDSCSYCGRVHSDLSACYVSGEPERGTEAHSEWVRRQDELANVGDKPGEPSVRWCGNDSAHPAHRERNEFGGFNECTGISQEAVLVTAARDRERARATVDEARKRGYPPTADFSGSNKERQSVGLPGHCEDCAAKGHVEAHPDLGCGDVGCNRAHPEPAKTGFSLPLRGYSVDDLIEDRTLDPNAKVSTVSLSGMSIYTVAEAREQVVGSHLLYPTYATSDGRDLAFGLTDLKGETPVSHRVECGWLRDGHIWLRDGHISQTGMTGDPRTKYGYRTEAGQVQSPMYSTQEAAVEALAHATRPVAADRDVEGEFTAEDAKAAARRLLDYEKKVVGVFLSDESYESLCNFAAGKPVSADELHWALSQFFGATGWTKDDEDGPFNIAGHLATYIDNHGS